MRDSMVNISDVALGRKLTHFSLWRRVARLLGGEGGDPFEATSRLAKTSISIFQHLVMAPAHYLGTECSVSI